MGQLVLRIFLACRIGGLPKCLIEVGEDVVDVLDPDREPHRILRYARGRQLLLVQLRMSRGCIVDRKRLGIADVGQVAEELQALDELAPALPSSLDAEADQASVAAREDSVGDRLVRARLQTRIVDPGRARMLLEVPGNRECVLGVALDPERQCLQPLQ